MKLVARRLVDVALAIPLLCYYIEWWPFRGDDGGAGERQAGQGEFNRHEEAAEAHMALSQVMLKVWRDGKVEKDA